MKPQKSAPSLVQQFSNKAANRKFSQTLSAWLKYSRVPHCARYKNRGQIIKTHCGQKTAVVVHHCPFEIEPSPRFPFWCRLNVGGNFAEKNEKHYFRPPNKGLFSGRETAPTTFEVIGEGKMTFLRSTSKCFFTPQWRRKEEDDFIL